MSESRVETLPSYPVGFARPPIETRFQKGRSGNPGGRRKRAPTCADLDELILKEAYRPVTVREGERVTTLPAIQAVLRAQIQAAAKGNAAAQRAVLEVVRRVEDKQEARHEELIKSTFEYQRDAHNRRVRMIEQGIPIGPDTPHPDDFVVDMRTGDVYATHPDFAEEARPQNRLGRPTHLFPKRDEAEG